MIALFVGLAVFIGGLILVAFLPSLVARLVKGWAWLYTARLPSDIRARRRAEMRSDLWEHARAERELGYRPESIALHQFLRCLFGIPADLSWRRSQVRQSRHVRPRSLRRGLPLEPALAEKLVSELQQLDPLMQKVVALKFDIELSNAEIARLLDLSAAKVGVELDSALKQLRNSLAHDLRPWLTAARLAEPGAGRQKSDAGQ